MRNKESEPERSTSATETGNKSASDAGSCESSSDSLIEIKVNECIKRSEISDFDIRALVVKCSSCGRQINHFSNKECKRHRKLGVITCKECYEFYGSSEFSQDESGYNYCTWCGNGGKLIVCDFCPNGFCSACIRRNFGRAEISVTTKEGWKCYCCNKKSLKPKIKFCNLILENKNHRKEKKVLTNATKTFSEDWIDTAFNESEEACKRFHRKMASLKTKGINKSKSVNHVVKKLEFLINGHKTALKNVVSTLTEHHNAYKKLQLEMNERKSDPDCVILDQDIRKESSLAETNEASVAAEKNEDSVTAEQNKTSAAELSDSSISILTCQDKTNSVDEKKNQAKLSLLKSSSESDDVNSVELADTDIPCNGELNNDNSKDDDSDKSKTKISQKGSSILESSNTSNSKSNNKAKRKLMFDLSNDSSDSDFVQSKPNVEKFLTVPETPEKELSEEENKEDREKVPLDPKLDPKLTLEPQIHLIRCDHKLEEGETSLKLFTDEDAEDRLDRLIESLCKFPLMKKKSAPRRKQKCGPLCSKKRAAKKELMESSSSISLSSEDEEEKKKVEIKKSEIVVPKENSSNSDSSSDILASESEDEKKRSKKSKGSKKGESRDSSDDFVIPNSKKKKYDKLLHGPLLSDDEEKKPRENKEKKGTGRKRRVVLSSDEDKKDKKEKKSEDSCSSTTSSDDDDSKKKRPKKRRRIKEIGSSSEEEDVDTQSQDTPGKGRKNIRKIVSQKKLAQSTKEAQLEEKERRRRIAERQRLYNKIEDMSIDGKEVITRKMVLEVDKDSKEEIVEIHPDLVCKLKPHQVNGVKFMWECTIESVKELDKPGSGCILAHCMGLGKTLQVIAFLHTILTNPIISKKFTRAMIICPYNTALNWASEFDHWLEDIEGNIMVHQLTSVKSNNERMDILKYWYVEGGVIILSYDIFRRLSANKIPKLKTKERNQIYMHLLDPGPDIVVCDEGHILKNDKSAISLATNKLNTRRRIVLTGTPLQNNLKEYHCMLSFVKPNLLGTAKEFLNRFVNPIINGQYYNSNDYDVKLMKKRIHILHKLLEGCVQRCDYSALTKFLPAKHEFVISVKLSDVQIKMYRMYLERRESAQKDVKAMGKTLFVDFNSLRCIWTHPYICHVSHEKQEYKRLLKDESEEEFINDSTEPSAAESSSSDEEVVDSSNETKEPNEEKKQITKSYRTRSRVAGGEEVEPEPEEEVGEVKQWYHEFISDEDKYNLEISGKMDLLMEILRECETIGDKIIVFSQSLLALDCIENMLEYCSSQPISDEDKKRDAIGTWTKGLDYFRMDGNTSADFRKSYIDMFNDPSKERSRLFLISTRAGSLGTNLVGANRVVLLDTSWNPSHDVQAIFRVYRFGQVKPVYIYRLLAQGTMEEKIYDRQVTKLSLSCRVVDEQQIDRHFNEADLAELYVFEPLPTPETTPMMPNDRLLAEMLIKKKNWIIKYHEHDSLLQNQTEEDLTEEERQAAWTEYENEREGRGPPPSGGLLMDEISNMTREPDFTQDYEGNVLPDMKTFVETLFKKIQLQNPTVNKASVENHQRLLAAVYTLRQALQEKHVKTLRIKQEYCTRGTVPASVNKYLDELTQSLKTTGDYAFKLGNFIRETQQKQQQQQNPQQQQQQQQAPNNAYYPRWRYGNIQQPQVFPRMANMGTFPNNIQSFVVGGKRFTFTTARQPTNMHRPPNVAQRAPKPPPSQVDEPIITYADDNVPSPEVPVNPNPKQHTVIIEDIS